MSNFRDKLRERFHAVILGAGYSEAAAQGILAQYFDEYMKKPSEFIGMLEEYESHGQRPA